MNHFILKILTLILIFTTLTFSIEWEGNQLLDRISFKIEAIDQSSLVARGLVCPYGSGQCPNNKCCPLNSFCARGGCCPHGTGQCPNGSCAPPNFNCCKDGSKKYCPLAPSTEDTTIIPPQGPGESPIWKGLKTLSCNGKHLRSKDPVSGDMIKPPVKGRKIKI
ncbi:unnamed protein product [Rhizophagus irregularis]|nr:unnamed protein product [Rhizophagus irregularis]